MSILAHRRKAFRSSGTWTPESVTSANILFWLEPDSFGSTWADKSAAGNDWTLAANPPSVTTGGAEWLSEDIVRFGTNDCVTGPSLTSLTGGEIFILYARDSDPATNSDDSGLWQFGTDSIWPVLWTDGNWYEDFGRAARVSSGNPSLSMTSPRIIDMISVSGEWTLKVDGSNHYTTATNTPAFRSVPYLGALPVTTYSMMGEIRAVIMYDGKLSTGDRGDVETYLDGLRQ